MVKKYKLMMRRMCFVVVFALEGLTDEYSGQHRENESLQESNQHFDQVNEYSESDRQRGGAPTRNSTEFTEYENE
jgi:hypothetical protein